MFSAGAGVFFPEPEFFFAGAGAGGEKPGVCTALPRADYPGMRSTSRRLCCYATKNDILNY